MNSQRHFATTVRRDASSFPHFRGSFEAFSLVFSMGRAEKPADRLPSQRQPREERQEQADATALQRRIDEVEQQLTRERSFRTAAAQDTQRNRTGGMATAGTAEDPHLMCVTGDGAAKGVVIGHFPGSTELLNQSSADVTKWLLYQEMKGEDNLVLRARLKQVMPDLARIYQTRELLPGGNPCEPPVFVELVLTADRPFLRHATGCSGNSADAFGAPHCSCHGDKLFDFTSYC